MRAIVGFHWIFSKSVFDRGCTAPRVFRLQKAPDRPQPTRVSLSNSWPAYTRPTCIYSQSIIWSSDESDISDESEDKSRFVDWYDRYVELCQYQRDHGNTLVPVRYEENLSLGYWVSWQRRHYKANNLLPERKQKLNEIGFVWDPFEIQWLERFEELLLYRQKHGNSLVPFYYKANPSLGLWVKKQREDYKAKKLLPERMHKLGTIGFIWDPHEAQWLERYAELLEYKQKYESTIVPQKFEGNSSLGLWVREQRLSYKANKLSLDRVKKLKEIGFVWGPNEAKWLEQFEALSQYKLDHGNTLVPARYEENVSLGKWVDTQRKDYKTNKLLPDRIDKLNSIAFVWDAREALWLERYEELIEYKQKYGNALVPSRFAKNPSLGSWVSTQRAFYKANKLSFERVLKLIEIGFVWSLRERRQVNDDDSDELQWLEHFEELLEYMKAKGDLCVPKEYKENLSLGAWVHHQRQLRKARKQTVEHVMMLDGIGFVWEMAEDSHMPKNF